MTEGFDVGLEMSGNAEAFRDMLATMNHGGRVAMLGIPPERVAIDWTRSSSRAWCSRASTAARCSRPGTRWPRMLQSGLDIRPVITHRLPIADFQQAFETMRKGQSGKVVLDWAAKYSDGVIQMSGSYCHPEGTIGRTDLLRYRLKRTVARAPCSAADATTRCRPVDSAGASGADRVDLNERRHVASTGS